MTDVTGIQGRKPQLVVWLWTGVSSGNRPTNVIKNAGNTAGIARRLECLECLGRLSWMPWESSGISEIARVTNVRFPLLTHGLMIRLADQSDGYVYYTYLALRYDLMGIIPRKGFPCVRIPTICFRMAAGAIAFHTLPTRPLYDTI